MRSRKLIDEILTEREPDERFIDLCLLLTHKAETILCAGGRWDLLDRKWAAADPESCQAIEVHEGQLEFVRFFTGWLRAFREGSPRATRLALAGGARRGGKTFAMLACTLAALIDVPQCGGSGTIGWLVSKAFTERTELDREIAKILLPGWADYREFVSAKDPKRAPHSYRFAHGSELICISADDPSSLKKGRVDILLINEAQKMSREVLSNVLAATVDSGGISLLAANPPKKVEGGSRGEWIYDLQQETIAGVHGEKIRYFNFDPTLNPHIDQQAKRDTDQILRIIDPDAAQVDSDGIWTRPGDYAYEAFSRNNIRKAPDLGDITQEFTKKKIGKAYPYVGGYDPNDRPHHAGVVCKIFGSLAKPILFVVDEFLVSTTEGEDGFLEAVEYAGYTPNDIVWVMDNSGFFQGVKRIPGRFSIDFFEARGWKGIPNSPSSVNSKTGRGRNPNIELRVDLMNRVLYSDPAKSQDARVYLDPSCKQIAEALKRCPSKKVRCGYGPYGKYSHATDALGYVCWWAFPAPGRKFTGPLAVTGDPLFQDRSFYG